MRISDWSSDVCSSDLAAIDRIVGQAAIRRTRAVTSAVEPVDQIDHPFEIERVKALDHRRIVRTADALELVGQADQLEDIVGNVRRRSRAAPGFVLDKSVSGTHIAVDIGSAEIDAVEDRSVMVVTADRKSVG